MATAIDVEAERAAIVRTVHDYYQGWFDGDRGRMQRALHAGLAKRSIEPRDGSLEQITAAEMVEWTATGQGRRDDPAERRYDIEIAHLSEHIAAVTVTGPVYDEYLHLVRTPGGWKIINALYRRV